jgi:hypothetical protein
LGGGGGGGERSVRLLFFIDIKLCICYCYIWCGSASLGWLKENKNNNATRTDWLLRNSPTERCGEIQLVNDPQNMGGERISTN